MDTLTVDCHRKFLTLSERKSLQGNKPVQVQSESAALVPIGPALIGAVRLIGRAPAARSQTYGTINNGWLD